MLARKGRPSTSYGRITITDYATSGWVVSLDYPNSRDVIQPKYFDNGFVPPGSRKPFIPKREIADWRPTDQILRLKNGSIIGFKSAETAPTKLQGAGKDWIHFDEVPPKPHYEEAVIRVEGGRALTIFGTATLLPPIGQVGGVNWLFEDLVKPWRKGKRPDVEIFTAGIRDNPYIGRAEIDLLEAMFPVGSKAHDIRIEGKLIPGLGGSLAYHAYEPSIHVVNRGEIDIHRPLAWCWDFNVEPMVTLVGQRDSDRFILYRELILEEGNIPDMCEAFYNVLMQVGLRSEVWIYGDSTGMNRSAQYGDTDYRVIQNQLVKYGVPFRRKVPERNPMVADRLAAVNRAFKDEYGVANVEINEHCSELISDLEGVLLENTGGIKKSHNRKDPYYRRTHASDAMGYWIAFEAPVRRLDYKARESIKIKRVGYGFG